MSASMAPAFGSLFWIPGSITPTNFSEDLAPAAAYTAAYGTTTADTRNTTTDGLFPTAKVVGGFDFVGERWPSGPLAPDPDPIDCGPSAIAAPCAGGHGTHVADIIAGNDSVSHKGVAPGALLYAVKVCSTVSTSCSGWHCCREWSSPSTPTAMAIFPMRWTLRPALPCRPMA